MDNTPKFNTPLQNFLNTTIIDQPYAFIDYWSFVHFFSGMIIGLLLAKYYPKKHPWLVALGLMAAYEIIEPLFVGILFVSENITDVAYDLIVGMAGYFVMRGILWLKRTFRH